MTVFDTTTHPLYLVTAVCFVLGLHLMNSPATARRGNQLSALGMAVAVGLTVVVLVHDRTITATATIVLVAGVLVGAGAGRRRPPHQDDRDAAARELVQRRRRWCGCVDRARGRAARLRRPTPIRTTLATSLDVLIGGVTFSGSLIAAGKLAGLVPGRPLTFRGGRVINLLLGLIVVTAGITYTAQLGAGTTLVVLTVAALALGVLITLPIGGADMPVVISLLNACTGTAVAMAGFVIDSTPLIIAGALVGAAGGILTKLMAVAMNRSLLSIVAGGFGTGDEQSRPLVAATGTVRSVTADDAALQLAYAVKVVIVPGYGLAAAQAQHEVVELAEALTEHGVDVSYGIHPVAGRMPGHMNVLLAEANAPYPQLKDLDEINPQFPATDVVLVVGANDVTNPAARRPGNAVSGMPILDVDKARSVIVVKRSIGHGYAGIDNELLHQPQDRDALR